MGNGKNRLTNTRSCRKIRHIEQFNQFYGGTVMKHSATMQMDMAMMNGMMYMCRMFVCLENQI